MGVAQSKIDKVPAVVGVGVSASVGGMVNVAKSAHDPMNSTERENLGAWHRYGVDVSDVYEVIEVLAQGHMGEVTMVRRKKENRGVHNPATRSRSRSEPDLRNHRGRAGGKLALTPLTNMKKRINGGGGGGAIGNGKENRLNVLQGRSSISLSSMKKKASQRCKFVRPSDKKVSGSSSSLESSGQPHWDETLLPASSQEPPPSPRSILKQASHSRRETSDSSEGPQISLFASQLSSNDSGIVKQTSSFSDSPIDDYDESVPPPPLTMSPTPQSEDMVEEPSDDDDNSDDDSFLQMWSNRLREARQQREQMLRKMESPFPGNGDKAPHGGHFGEHSFSALGVSQSCHNRSVRFQRQYACKTVLLSHIKSGQLKQLLNEISIMRTLNHPYILQLHEVYQTKRKIWLISELCTGGDLTTRKLNEPEATAVIEQVLRALTYMHSRGILHRNIKLEHILYEDGGKDATIRLIDFGLSKQFNRAEKSHKAVQTTYTMCPEIASRTGNYTEKSDIWAVGVVAWILLAGDAPFIRSEEDLKCSEKLDRLIRAEYSFGITWTGRGISSYAKEFVRRCLQRHPGDRWKAKAALRYVESTWIPALEREDVDDEHHALKRTISSKRRSGAENVEMADIIKMEDINRFCNYGRLKKTMLMTMAQILDKVEVERLREIFLAADTEETGTITLLELKQAFRQINPNMDDKTLESIFRGIDQDHSGEIHWAEFVAALSESQELVTLDRLAEAFDRIDSDGKGYISREDLKKLLGKDYNEDLVESMIEEGDFKRDGQIDYEELMQLMFENPSTGARAVGNINEALRIAGMEDITEPVQIQTNHL